MIDFTPTDEQGAIRDTVRRFVDIELVPYETILIQREIEGDAGASRGLLTASELRHLQDNAKGEGLWGIDAPTDLGGVDLDSVSIAIINEELGRTFVDFEFGGSVIQTLYGCNEAQRERYLLPTLQVHTLLDNDCVSGINDLADVAVN